MSIRQLLSGAILCACSCAWSQDARTPAPVTLAEVQRAAAAGVDVSLARRALTAVRGDVAAADHAPAPQVIAKASQMDLQNGLGPGNVFRDKRIDKSIGVDWTLERGDKRELRTRAAEAAVRAASADVQEAVVQQQIAASNAFYDLLAAQEKLAHVAEIRASADQLAQAARRRVDAGDLSRQEAARVAIEDERARADAQAAEADRVRASLALAQAAGLAAPIAAVGGWPPLERAGTETDAPGIERRADVRAARARVEAAQRALDGAFALRKSDVTVGASYDHFPGTSTRLVELRLQVPLAGEVGYGYQGEIARAQAQLAQAEDQLEKTRRAAATETARLAQDLRAASGRAASYQDTIVPRAREVAQMAEYAYGRGALGLTELLDARRTLRTVLLEDVAARADHARALGAWRLRQREPADPDSP